MGRFSFALEASENWADVVATSQFRAPLFGKALREEGTPAVKCYLQVRRKALEEDE